MPTIATTRVGTFVWGNSAGSSRTTPTVVWLVTCTPRTDFSCPTMMTTPTPALKPMRTGSETKLATNPRRSRRATIKTPPTRSASIAATAAGAAPLARAVSATTCAEVNIAISDVLVTLSGRELPSSGYTSIAAIAV